MLSVMIAKNLTKLDNQTLDVIIGYIRQHIRGHTQPRGAIHLLRAIIKQKLMSPVIYDLMHQIHEELAEIQSETLTYHYSNILMNFLLNYPLTDKAINKHIERAVSGFFYFYFLFFCLFCV